jgi:hypothetical protein
MKKAAIRISLHRETLQPLVSKVLVAVAAGISAVCTKGKLCDTTVC